MNETPSSSAVPAKFRSLVKYDLQMWYDDGYEGAYLGELKYGQEMSITTYEGHEFFFTKNPHIKDATGPEVVRVYINVDQALYVLRVNEQETTDDNSLIARNSALEEAFMRDYFARTGRHWLHYFNGTPRPPPVLPMRNGQAVGHREAINSSILYWVCADESSRRCRSTSPLSQEGAVTEETDAPSTVLLQVETIALSPRAFIVENFLSDFEVDALIDQASPHIEESLLGQSDSGGVISSTTRTSRNTWIRRDSNVLVDSIYRRIADISGIDEQLLTPERNAENMQVVHYDVGEAYSAHHDWGVRGYEESRFLTVLLYLTDSPHANAGGETAFPKGGADGSGIMVVPKRGNAVMFYNLLEDGNADELSLHAALAVEDGEKWLANVWIWDPKLANSIREKPNKS